MTKTILAISLFLLLSLSGCGPVKVKPDPPTAQPVAPEKQYPPADLVQRCPGVDKPLAPVTWFDLSVYTGRLQDSRGDCDSRMACLAIWRKDGKGTAEETAACERRLKP